MAEEKKKQEVMDEPSGATAAQEVHQEAVKQVASSMEAYLDQGLGGIEETVQQYLRRVQEATRHANRVYREGGAFVRKHALPLLGGAFALGMIIGIFAGKSSK